MNRKKYNQIKARLLGCALVLGILLSGGCKDEELFPEYAGSGPLEVEEGVEGKLSILLASDAYQKRNVMARNSPYEHSEQHVHSVYLFVIDMNDESHPEHCRIVSRKYFPDVSKYVEEVTEGGIKAEVTKLSMPAVSCQKAQIFAIANLGYSEVQGIDNDAVLLQRCDTLSSLKVLMDLAASLSVNEQNEINVERMQGYHLMSGFFRTAEKHNYLDRNRPMVTLKTESDGSITLYDVNDKNIRYRPLGIAGEGTPSAIFVHRLDSKITVKIKVDGALKNTPGASLKLVSWQVLNAPIQEHVYWYNPDERFLKKNVKDSKVFRRDLTQDEDGGWEFTFYQFENYSADKKESYPDVDAKEIARQYIKEFNWTSKDENELAKEIPEAFTAAYPNKYSNFAYTMRELKEKKKGEDGTEGDYEPNLPDNDDQTIVVANGDFVHAPEEATYIRLQCSYYNPQEPARRMADDPRSMQWEKRYPLVDFPYWGEKQIPVATEKEALKRTRAAAVTYIVHMGYVGGGNYELTDKSIPKGDELKDFSAFQKKLNDYNVLRNHHYTYTLTVSGVENIKLEATREDGGNIYEQEKQPGAEGNILEAQHYINLDAHYASRNLTLDFTRFPEEYEKGFSFGIFTPFYELRAVLKKKEDGSADLLDQNGNKIEGIRGQDMDWIHFVWHGMLENPSRSLVDEKNGNGISYSETYGGYEFQQTYLEKNLTHEKDATHQYRLLNSFEFVQLVWRQFALWQQQGKPINQSTITFTVYVDENYYDFNPVTNAQVNWPAFCNKPTRKALFFMEPDEVSADQNSWYGDAHLAIFQQSIQTLYATNTSNGQVIANTAFGIEGFDEFRAKYNCVGTDYNGNGRNAEYPTNHYFHGESMENGLYNTMLWFKNHSGEVIDWKEAMNYYTEKSREKVLDDSDYQQSLNDGRNNRRGEWAIYSRNRDLNRNGVLDADEIRWFVPAIDQYVLCFLGGRPVFENPLFEKSMSVQSNYVSNWLQGVPVLHFMSSTVKDYNSIFWAEEGCSKGNYGDGKAYPLYGIRMARMLCNHGVKDTGEAFMNNMREDNLLQDALFTVSQTRNGSPIDKEQRVDGKTYYILLNKMNADAFRDYINVGELSEHTHEQKQNWLYREYHIAKNMIGYRSYDNPINYDRHPTVNGVPRTWYQVTGVWSDNKFDINSPYYYRGEQHSLAFDYNEDLDGSDIHHWRIPNLREAAIMSMAFPESWFPHGTEQEPLAITSGTVSDNLGQYSTNLPFWIISSGQIQRLPSNSKYRFYVRPIRDVK